MNATTLQSPAPKSLLPSWAVLLVNGGRRVPSSPIHKAVHLERDHVLGIRDGRGMRITPASGVLWITEESSAGDIIVTSGDSYRIGNEGTTVVLAHRAARLVLEVPAGIRAPRCVELARGDSAPGACISLGSRARVAPATIATAAVNAIRRWLRATPEIRPHGARSVQAPASLAAGPAHSSWRAHDPFTDRDTPLNDPNWSARDAVARHHPFPYY